MYKNKLIDKEIFSVYMSFVKLIIKKNSKNFLHSLSIFSKQVLHINRMWTANDVISSVTTFVALCMNFVWQRGRGSGNYYIRVILMGYGPKIRKRTPKNYSKIFEILFVIWYLNRNERNIYFNVKNVEYCKNSQIIWHLD